MPDRTMASSLWWQKKDETQHQNPIFNFYSRRILALFNRLNITSWFSERFKFWLFRGLQSQIAHWHIEHHRVAINDRWIIFQSRILSSLNNSKTITNSYNMKIYGVSSYSSIPCFLNIFHFEIKSLFKTRLLNVVSKNRFWLRELFPVVFSYFARNGHGTNKKW